MASSCGGALAVLDTDGQLANLRFIGNQSAQGGAMLINDSSVALRNLHFSDNSAHDNGGALAVIGDTAPILWNVSMAHNIAGGVGGGIYQTAIQTLIINNSILWDNQCSGLGHQLHNASNSSSDLRFSLHRFEVGDILGGFSYVCTDCSHDDPLFRGPASGDLSLEDGSPAIDTGNPATPLGIFPTDENLSPIDIMGNPRFTNGIDMGAYEWWPERIFADRFE